MIATAVKHPRARWVGLLTVVLLVSGTGAASAYWTAQDSVRGNASAATVGLQQQLHSAASGTHEPDTYSADALTHSRAVSLTNTGSREANYTLTVGPASSADPGLPAAVRVVAAPVAARQDCTPQGGLDHATLGTLAKSLDVVGKVPAGGTVVLCMQTSLDATGIRTFADAQLAFELTATLAYADAQQWILNGSSPMTVTQRVASDPLAKLERMAHVAGEKYSVQLSFTQHSGQNIDKSKIQYRVFLAHEKSPNTRVAYPVGALQGYYTVVEVTNHPASPLVAFANSPQGGFGNTWIIVEEKLPGNAVWTPVAAGQIHTTREISPFAVYYGWK